MTTKKLTIEMTFDEDPNVTAATVTMKAPNGSTLRGYGRARRNPQDPPSPQIGEEVAGARALHQLASELLESAANEIEESVHRPVHLTG